MKVIDTKLWLRFFIGLGYISCTLKKQVAGPHVLQISMRSTWLFHSNFSIVDSFILPYFCQFLLHILWSSDFRYTFGTHMFLRKWSFNHWYDPILSLIICLVLNLSLSNIMGFHSGSEAKQSASMHETWVQSQCWEDTLEKGMATHSGILAWRIP